MNEQDRLIHQETIAHCTALRESAHFGWFLKYAVLEPMAEADAATKNLKIEPAEREAAVHQWNSLNALVVFLKEQEETAKKLVDRP